MLRRAAFAGTAGSLGSQSCPIQTSMLNRPTSIELGRTRSGDMRGIVATIQGEQDEIIRWPSDDLVIVHGGPGTGKTAVGLHRAAYLLYERRVELERDGVLVVGPNPTFLEYISGVLPSLGETTVRQTTIDGLFGGRYRVALEDPDDLARLKGDPRLAVAVDRACLAKISRPSSDLTIDVRSRRVRLDVRAVRDALEKSLAGVRTLKLGRELFTERLQRMAFRAFAERHDPSVDEADFLRELRSTGSLTAARNQLWPSINPALDQPGPGGEGTAVRGTVVALGCRSNLGRGRGEAPRKRSSQAKRQGTWARGDLPLLDEAEARVAGPSFVYGHVIVDEAQDLSPMEARMIGRRALVGSMTVLGDLAQATGLVAQTDWRETIRHLDTESEPKTFQLTVGYRVPLPIMEFANRLLPAVAPHVPATESIRLEGTEPRLVAVEAAGLMQRAWDEAAALAERWVTVGVIAPRSLRDQAIELFSELDPQGKRWREEHLDAGLTLLSPAVAKGLEFDAVVLLEPQRIAREELHGHRMLYVALTRAVQELTVIHAEPLPELIAAP